MSEDEQRGGISRRTVTTAAWAAPVVAIAVAAPSAAASTVDVGAFQVYGICGIQFVSNPGFLLTAGPSELPAGTVLMVDATGVANAGTFSATGDALTEVAPDGPRRRRITLLRPLPAAAVLDVRTTLSTAVSWTLEAAVTLPVGYLGTGSKAVASVTSAVTGCTAF